MVLMVQKPGAAARLLFFFWFHAHHKPWLAELAISS